MLARGTKLKENQITHREDGVTEITAYYKGEPQIVLVDTIDWPLVEPYYWFIDQVKKGQFYVSTYTGQWQEKGKRKIRMHRLFLPDSKQVDHIDRNRFNHCRSNLRAATNQQNNMNRGKIEGTSCKYIGVSWDSKRKKFQAGIKFNGKRIALGRFISAEEAARVRDAKAVELFGEFASLNFPKQ